MTIWANMPLPDRQTRHVFPVQDSGGHRIAEDGNCPCGARPHPENPALIVHRAWNGSDLVEQAEAIINAKAE